MRPYRWQDAGRTKRRGNGQLRPRCPATGTASRAPLFWGSPAFLGEFLEFWKPEAAWKRWLRGNDLAGRGEERRCGKRPSELQREEGLFPSGHLDPLSGQGQGINPGSLRSSGALCNRPHSSSWGARGGPRGTRCGRIHPLGFGDAPRRPGTAPAGCWGAHRDAYGAKGILESPSTPKKSPSHLVPRAISSPVPRWGPKCPKMSGGPAFPWGLGLWGGHRCPAPDFSHMKDPPQHPKKGP